MEVYICVVIRRKKCGDNKPKVEAKRMAISKKGGAFDIKFVGINFRGTGLIHENCEHFYTLEIYPLYTVSQKSGGTNFVGLCKRVGKVRVCGEIKSGTKTSSNYL